MCDHFVPCLQVKNLMVVGIDSYHDSASRGRSVGGFIASTNNTLTRCLCVCSRAFETRAVNYVELLG